LVCAGVGEVCAGAAVIGENLKEEDTVVMATLPIDDGFISVREYLRTSYSPDCEYVDGRIVERNVGEKLHSALLGSLTFLFAHNRDTWRVEVFPTLRMHVSSTRVRVPDVLVVRAGAEFEHVLDQPPLIVIEILSPRDTLSGLQEKIDEYIAFETEHIWVFDPIRRLAWTADRGGLHPVNEDALTVPGTPILAGLAEAWAELDRV